MIIMSHLQPGLDIHVSPFNSHLTPIYIPQNASQFHPGPISSHTGPKVSVSPPSRPHLTPIHIARFASHLLLYHVSPPVSSPGLQLTCIQVPSHSIQVPKSVSHLHPVYASSPSRSRYSCHIFIQVTSCLHPGPDPGPKNGISAPSKSHLSSPRTRDFCFTSIQVPLHLNSGPRIHVSFSPPSMSRLTSIQVRLTLSTFSTSFVTHIHPGCVSPPSRT